jgi:hypothetical protein
MPAAGLASESSDSNARADFKPGWTCENSHCWKRYDFDV